MDEDKWVFVVLFLIDTVTRAESDKLWNEHQT